MKNTLFAIGEALIDFIPDKTGCDFSDVTAFSPKVGGAPANVLGAFSRLGGKTELLTMLGNDPFGHKIKKELSEFGIGLDYLEFTDSANTALAFVSLEKDGGRTFSFYRKPSADMLYTAENVDSGDFADCFALHFCSVSLGNFPMRDAHKRVLELAENAGAIISFDPNIRLPLWENTDELHAAVENFMPYADIVKVSDEEIGFVTGTEDIESACRKLLKTAKLAICTCGSRGVYAFTDKVSAFVPSEKVRAVDTTGAGDAFCGSFLYSLYTHGYTASGLENLIEKELEDFLRKSSGYCAKSVQKPGAIASYPTIL